MVGGSCHYYRLGNRWVYRWDFDIMPLLGSEQVIHAINTFRAVWIRGRYGGGKTFVSFLLAEQLSKRFGYGVFSNVKNTIGVPYYATSEDCQAGIYPDDVGVGDMVHTTVVYDEAWLSLGMGTSPKEVKKYLAFLRKRDFVLLMPSVLPMSKNAYLIWVERTFNLGALGIPLWIYQWGIAGQDAKKSGGRFVVWLPQKHFGMYDTLAQPDELPTLFGVE